MLAKNLRAPRRVRLLASSLTSIVGTPPGACSLLQRYPFIRGSLRLQAADQMAAVHCQNRACHEGAGLAR
jgi:hypothetical protein